MNIVCEGRAKESTVLICRKHAVRVCGQHHKITNSSSNSVKCRNMKQEDIVETVGRMKGCVSFEKSARFLL